MIKKEGFKNSKDCTLGWVTSGGRFVYMLPLRKPPINWTTRKNLLNLGTKSHDGKSEGIAVIRLKGGPFGLRLFFRHRTDNLQG
jgi:hypothetical protein